MEGKHNLFLHGSKRLDKIYGKDNTIKVKRDRIERFVVAGQQMS